MAISFDRVNRYIIPDTDIVTIQEIYDASQDYLDEPGNLDLAVFVEAEGKADLDAITQTGITLRVTEGWTIRWNPRTATSPEFILRRISGGNLAEVGGTLPITPSDGNTVVVQSSSSATIQNLEELQFGGEVWIDLVDGTAGTDFPQGTEEFPVDNLTDAITIATANNKRRYRLRTSTAALTLDQRLTNTEWTGFGGEPRMILAALVDEIRFSEIQIVSGDAQLNTSPLLPGPKFINCNLGDGTDTTLANVYGEFRDCAFDTVTLQLVPGSDTQIRDSESGRAGPLPGLTLDFQAAGGTACSVRQQSGGVELQNMAAGDTITVELNGGALTIDSSCTGGTVVLRGYGEPVRFPGSPIANVQVIDEGYLVGVQLQELWRLQALDPDNPMVVDLFGGRRFVGAGSPAEIEQTITKSSPEGTTTVQRTK